MFPESINSLLAQINQLVGSDFGNASDVHRSLHGDANCLGNTQIMVP